MLLLFLNNFLFKAKALTKKLGSNSFGMSSVGNHSQKKCLINLYGFTQVELGCNNIPQSLTTKMRLDYLIQFCKNIELHIKICNKADKNKAKHFIFDDQLDDLNFLLKKSKYNRLCFNSIFS